MQEHFVRLFRQTEIRFRKRKNGACFHNRGAIRDGAKGRFFLRPASLSIALVSLYIEDQRVHGKAGSVLILDFSRKDLRQGKNL